MSDYSNKLKKPKWQKKRLELFNLRGFKCEECGCEEKELHIHHRFYVKGRQPWEYDNDVFQVLCDSCHEKEHLKKDKTIEVVPEKYKQLIKLYELAVEKYPPNEHVIESVIFGYIDMITSVEFLSNIVIIFASNKHILLENIVDELSGNIIQINELKSRITGIESFLNI